MILRALLRLVPLLALGACVMPALISAPVVPPVRAERIPAPPPSAITLIWQPGHWDWDAGTYRWQAGEWVPRSGHGPLWQDGFWRRRGDDYVWAPAHWL